MCVNGSVIHDGNHRDWERQAKPYMPSAVLLCYGMNDGSTSAYNSGQTFTGARNEFRALCEKILMAGAVPVVMTTPHPHTRRAQWQMPEGLPQNFPVKVAAPVPEDLVVPSVPASLRECDPLSRGKTIHISYRHYRINEMMRVVAADLNVPMIDVEKYWFDARYTHDEDDLFEPGEIVHPNLKGHQLSLGRAMKDYVNGTDSLSLAGGGVPTVN